MYYVVGKHRIVVESESPVQMSDYKDCELVEGLPGVSMINFEVYEENGKKKVRTKLQSNPLKLDITLPDYECKNGVYEIKSGVDPVRIDVKLNGVAHLPPIIKVPEGGDRRKVGIMCTRGKLDKNEVFDSGTVYWTTVDETVEVVLMFTALNFPPIQETVRIQLK